MQKDGRFYSRERVDSLKSQTVQLLAEYGAGASMAELERRKAVHATAIRLSRTKTAGLAEGDLSKLLNSRNICIALFSRFGVRNPARRLIKTGGHKILHVTVRLLDS